MLKLRNRRLVSMFRQTHPPCTPPVDGNMAPLTAQTTASAAVDAHCGMAEPDLHGRLQRLIARDSARRQDRGSGPNLDQDGACAASLPGSRAAPAAAMSVKSILKAPREEDGVRVVQVEELEGSAGHPRQATVTPDLVQRRTVTFSAESPSRLPAKSKEVRRVVITVYDDPPERARVKPVPPPKPPDLAQPNQARPKDATPSMPKSQSDQAIRSGASSALPKSKSFQSSVLSIQSSYVLEEEVVTTEIVESSLSELNGHAADSTETRHYESSSNRSESKFEKYESSSDFHGPPRDSQKLDAKKSGPSESNLRRPEASSKANSTAPESSYKQTKPLSGKLETDIKSTKANSLPPSDYTFKPTRANSVPPEINCDVIKKTPLADQSSKSRAETKVEVEVNLQESASKSVEDGGRISQAKPPLPPRPAILPSTGVKLRTASARKNFFEKDHRAKISAPVNPEENHRFEQFRQQAREERAKLIQSTPDLADLETTLKQTVPSTKPTFCKPKVTQQSPISYRRAPSSTTLTDAQWQECVRRAHSRKHSPRPEINLGYLETDVDTLQCRTVQKSVEQQPLMTSHPIETSPLHPDGRAKSEYELRIERSLQNLSLPSWYRERQSAPQTLLKKREKPGEQKGWSVYSRTNSLSNLAGRALSLPKKDSCTSLKSSRESLQFGWKPGTLSRSTSSQSAFASPAYRSIRQPYLGWRAAKTPCETPTPVCEPFERTLGGDSGYLGSGSVSLAPTPPPPPSAAPPEPLPRQETTFGADGSCHTQRRPDSTPPRTSTPKPEAARPLPLLKTPPSDPRPAPAPAPKRPPSDTKPRHSVSENDLTRLKGPVLWIESSFVGRLSTTSVAVHPGSRQPHCRCPGCRKYGSCYYASQSLVATNP